MSKSYRTHDNGGRPFEVEVDGTKVSVYKHEVDFIEKDGKFIDIIKPRKKNC